MKVKAALLVTALATTAVFWPRSPAPEELAEITASSDRPASMGLLVPAAAVERSQAANQGSEPEVALEPAATTPELPQEPLQEEIQELREITPPGVLQGRVLRLRQPLASGQVWIKQSRGFSHLKRPWIDQSEVKSSWIENGRFRFEALESGDYVVGVKPAPEDPLHEAWCSIDEEKNGRSMVIVLGAASILGTVYDELGRTQAGALIALSRHFQADRKVVGDSYHLFAFTDAAGRYRLEHLLAGSYWVTCEPRGRYEYWWSKAQQTQTVTVDPQEECLLDFGRNLSLPQVEGQLVGADGLPVQGPGTLLIVPTDGGYRQTKLTSEGSFQVRLEPGTYELEAHLPSGEVSLADLLEVPDHDLRVQFDLPGIRLSGRVEILSNAPWPKRLGARISLQRIASRERPRRRSVSINDDGDYRFEGVPPGRWSVQAYPYPIHLRPLEIELDASERVRQLDLIVDGLTDPAAPAPNR
jgi:hypothetical protein